ncbi:MAG: hypothetical protein JST66_01750 [Bacteroidetes bacterium]|nr:hypothetical protein [Bacteroidota bacterium]
MSKRWLRIGLGVLVLGVWGAVIARALHRPGSDAEGLVDRPTAPSPPAATSGDTADAIPAFPRDPFLDDRAVAVQHPTATTPPASSRKAPPVPPPPPPPTRAWPKVTYKGTMRAKGDPSTTVAFLSVEGRDLLIKQGNESNGLGVVRMSADSIVLRWSGEERVFARR